MADNWVRPTSVAIDGSDCWSGSKDYAIDADADTPATALIPPDNTTSLICSINVIANKIRYKAYNDGEPDTKLTVKTVYIYNALLQDLGSADLIFDNAYHEVSILSTSAIATIVFRGMSHPENETNAYFQIFDVQANQLPVITSLDVITGPAAGGTTVHIAGTGFITGATVMFGASSATVTNITSTQITCTTPAHAAGAVNVQVTTDGGDSNILTNAYTYVAAPEKASAPDPADDAVGAALAKTLGWTNGAGTTANDMFFREKDSAEWVKKIDNTLATSWAGYLAGGKTYQWRVDCKNAGGTTTGDTWEFTIAKNDGGMTARLEERMTAILAALTYNGSPVFKTADIWKHQIAATAGGLDAMERFDRFAFAAYNGADGGREGDYDLRQALRFSVLFGCVSVEDGIARTGDASHLGTSKIRELIIAAFDKVHPGAAFNTDEWFYEDEVEIVDMEKKHAIQMNFSINWLSG